MSGQDWQTVLTLKEFAEHYRLSYDAARRWCIRNPQAVRRAGYQGRYNVVLEIADTIMTPKPAPVVEGFRRSGDVKRAREARKQGRTLNKKGISA